MLPAEIITRRNERQGSRLGDAMRRLASDNDGEIVAAAHGMRRILESVGRTINDLADHVETANGGGVPKELAEKIWHGAYSQGVQDTENKAHGGGDFRNTNGRPDWDQVALFVHRNKHRLDAKHHEFVDKMAAMAAWKDEGEEPSTKMHRYMHDLFFKLGGRIT